MKLFLLKSLVDSGYDSVRGFVIAAASEEDARALPYENFLVGDFNGCRYECGHSDVFLLDGEEQSPCIWRDAKTSSCEVIALESALPRGIVLRDFRAG